ncbi:hypothetical protein R1sor_016803 [Riccia sorocarpa]|uniref:Uncharacterized protein n=1 Tax=Riccia sorocarpa TaxID=122646 RepID=A0ABD3HJD4_9MARC
MIRSGQYMPGLKWATMKPMSQLRVERIWQGCVAPETITVTDIDYILFGSSHNDRYFSSSHRMELLIAEARKHKEEEDHKPDDREHQPRAPGSPDEDFDDDELPDIVDLDDIIEPGMDAKVLMFDLLAVGYGVRRRPAPRPEEPRNDQQQADNVIRENNDEMPEYIPLVRPPT